jgi:sugar phosphate isomerase/epimerase
MLLGVKTYEDRNFIEYFKDKVDFIEVMSFADNKYLLGAKVVIHCKHQGFGINPADKKKEKENRNELRAGQEIANLCNSSKIIFHPGFIENNDCSKEQAIKILREIEDKRIIIENLQKKKDSNTPCSNPEETKEFMEKTGKELCFDINHAISVAFQENLDPYDFIENFLKLNPVHYHLGGQTLPDDTTHLALTESNIDLRKVIGMLPENAEISLEVTQDIKKTEEDVKLFRKLWNETH